MSNDDSDATTNSIFWLRVEQGAGDPGFVSHSLDLFGHPESALLEHEADWKAQGHPPGRCSDNGTISRSTLGENGRRYGALTFCRAATDLKKTGSKKTRSRDEESGPKKV